ncbi:uncharacterized protein F4812DRAFT_428347 [Daldinia caldariorum]|uniref:uncharacterized protein n=1 Tax=Daldinia caldariorum TaxID=326644 RepID=UPI002008AAA1|nr:uncharacterized protein F4812DRAFT_428347 [Daldinia caldariorum]KAI1467983.1 hypothetical protein F4812DRAFT_428347 [Daldinia caldariorum]
MSSTGNASAQRVPAWKRLGLKLKAASEESQDATLHTGTVTPSVANHHREKPAGPINANAKRKSSGVPALDHSAKKPKRDNAQSQTASTHSPPKKTKSVSFAAESTQQAGSAVTKNGTQVTNKQKQSPKKASAVPAKPAKKQAAVNLEPALAYLRQWHTSKDTWKFNKNHQTRLLEQVFADETTIPAADINMFYEYIRGLKGAVRTRLRELASGTKAQDMELESQGFPTSNKEMAEKRQREYEEIIAAFLRQPRITGKRRFDEVDYVLRTSDIEMQRRVVKRMRCENVLDELSDSETETVSPTTTTAEESEGATSEGATVATEDVQRLRLNDGPPQRVKRKRKTRTAVVDEDTSSESDSSSDSDSDSSDSSSSDDGSGNEVAQPQSRAGDADTSSSSSSSESESTSDDSDDDSEDDD